MDPRYFFQGKLAREEAASAFLATLLASRADFRAFFFQQLHDITPERCTALTKADWKVKTEADQVDVRMEAGADSVLIENKIQAGAIQQDQLLRYYHHELDALAPPEGASEPTTRLLMVFLAPGSQSGSGEVQAVRESERYRSGVDVAVRLSWDALGKFPIASDDKDYAFVVGGFACIRVAIENARQVKFPVDTTRERVVAVMSGAHELLRTRLPRVHLQPWRGSDFEQLFTTGTNVTLWADAVFDPMNVVNGDALRLKLRTQLKLSAKGRKQPELKAWWTALAAAQQLEVPGVGVHTLNAKGWAAREADIEGSPAELQRRIADAIGLVFTALGDRLVG
ncbi:MAG: PD-(D/E)XK nuclease family protein [Myxococcales bacterium]|nr:PD-(D/E)XK nuclease family protein [Myxococcales bacterium]